MADTKPSTDKPTFTCHARRHMSGAVYKTYDAILAMALSKYSGLDEDGNPKPKRDPKVDPLIFYGKIRPTLVNHTNTGHTSLYEHIDKLLEDGWLIEIEPPDESPRERNAKGQLGPVLYYVFDHDDWLQQKPGRKCPAFKLKVDGKPEEKHPEPEAFAVERLIRKEAPKVFGPLADHLKNLDEEGQEKIRQRLLSFKKKKA